MSVQLSSKLRPSGSTNELQVIIETPKGSRNKFKWDPSLELFTLSGVLPMGATFPFDFGFVPFTRAPDGDPLDVLVLMDEPAFAGCVVAIRMVGAIEAEQTENGETMRNDRLIAVAAVSRDHGDISNLSDLNNNMLDEIEHFFISYNTAKGKEFKILGRHGPDRAQQLVADARQQPKPTRRR